MDQKDFVFTFTKAGQAMKRAAIRKARKARKALKPTPAPPKP